MASTDIADLFSVKGMVALVSVHLHLLSMH